MWLGCGGADVASAPTGAGGQAGGSGSAGATQAGQPELLSLSPTNIAGGVAATVVATARNLSPGDALLVDGNEISATIDSPHQATLQLPPLARGTHKVQVHRLPNQLSNELPLEVSNANPQINLPSGEVVLTEDQAWVWGAQVVDPDGDDVRVLVTDLPPGATWNETQKRLIFRPDFLQGGQQYNVQIRVRDGHSEQTYPLPIRVLDTISPPPPTVVNEQSLSTHTRLTIEQTTDDYLDSPGHAGRTFKAVVTIPKSATAQSPAAVRIGLHGFGTSNPSTAGSSSLVRIAPHDPNNTYWWGYAASLPGGEANAGNVHPYTARRVLHLLGWVLSTYPKADAHRVYLSGSSMGGAGAATIGLRWARHFAWVYSTLGQMVAENHRPSRRNQLSGYWGQPSLGLLDDWGESTWKNQDLTRLMGSSAEARGQFLSTKHSKDDSTIHFGAVVQKSPNTGASFFETVESLGVAHRCFWDEGGHGTSDPVMGSSWWSGSFSPMDDDTTWLRNNHAHIGFSKSSGNQDPGTGEGNGKQTYSENSGYSGTVSTPGDTGWDGDVAGGLNRFLLWDSNTLVDELDRFEVDLWVQDGSGSAAPQSGYPTKGDRLDQPVPINANVTPRRCQAFQARAGESFEASFGGQSFEVKADGRGEITVPNLPLGLNKQRLVIKRKAAPGP